jgi:hypothetical protein
MLERTSGSLAAGPRSVSHTATSRRWRRERARDHRCRHHQTPQLALLGLHRPDRCDVEATLDGFCLFLTLSGR